MDIRQGLGCIAVMGWYGADISTDLKRAALCFDKIAVRHVHRKSECKVFSATAAGRRTSQSIDWLHENNATVAWPEEIMPDDDFSNRVPARVLDTNPELFEQLNSTYRKNNLTALRCAFSDPSDFRDPDPREDTLGFQSKDLATRAAALYFRLVYGVNAVPIVDQLSVPSTSDEIKSFKVANIVFDAMPDADSMTPWEAIRDFRADYDMRDRLIRFRRWISQRVGQGIEPNTVVEEMRDNLFDYEEYMRQQHRKVKLGIMETVVTVVGEIIEDALKLKLSQLANTLVNIRKREVQLLDAELQAPGREMAYLSHVYERFSPMSFGLQAF